MASYRFVDQGQQRAVTAQISDPHIKIKDLIPQLIIPLKMTAIDSRGQEMIYLLAYKGRFLNGDETLASAGIPPNETIDVIGNPMDLGSGRHSREWDDYRELMDLHSANSDIFDLDILGRAFDDAPIHYRLTFKAVAGPVVDLSKVQRMSAPMLCDVLGEPLLNERFVADIFILERYPFSEPGFFYVDTVPFHPNVNPYSRKACLYSTWSPIHTLAGSVERFVQQISYLARPAEDIHLLNQEALVWYLEYRRKHPGRLPFKNKAGNGPPAFQKPVSAANAFVVNVQHPTPPSSTLIVDDEDEIEITIN